MKLKLITCDVLTRLVCHCVARTPHIIDMDFTPKGAHNDAEYLRKLIQQKVDATEESERKYDAIILGYGLCGNSVVNLIARSIPLVIPRVHDCCTIFLGSKEKYLEHFGERLSMEFSTAGYMERGDSYVREAGDIDKKMGWDKTYQEYVEKYGEENAKFIWETLHPQQTKNNPHKEEKEVIFIEIPQLRHLGYSEECRRKAQAEGKKLVEIEGSIELIEKLIFGEWSEKDFLIIQPGQRIMGVYDMEEVIRAVE